MKLNVLYRSLTAAGMAGVLLSALSPTEAWSRPRVTKSVAFAGDPGAETPVLTRAQNLEVLRGVRSVVIPQFTVEFVETSTGLGGAKSDGVKVVYNVVAIGDGERQAIVDRLYQRYIAGLQAQGVTVSGPADAAKTQAWSKVASSTRPAPAFVERPSGATRIFSAQGVPYLVPTDATQAQGQAAKTTAQATGAARLGGMFNSRLAGVGAAAGGLSALGNLGTGLQSAGAAMRYGRAEPELAAETASAVMTVRVVVGLRETDKPTRLFASLRSAASMVGEPKLAILGESSSVSIFAPNARNKRAVVEIGPDLLFQEDLFEGRVVINNGAVGTASNVAARGMFLAGAVGSSFLGTPGVDLAQSHTVECAPDQTAFTAAVERNLSATTDMFLARLSGRW